MTQKAYFPGPRWLTGQNRREDCVELFHCVTSHQPLITVIKDTVTWMSPQSKQSQTVNEEALSKDSIPVPAFIQGKHGRDGERSAWRHCKIRTAREREAAGNSLYQLEEMSKPDRNACGV
ncbi:hypothetical protein MC885_007186 [Smutsia gigantea]|nr:hypothetical protein MC885_007186 [Smutsia gigantea]